MLDITDVVRVIMGYKQEIRRQAIHSGMPQHEKYVFKQEAADELLALLNWLEAQQRGIFNG